MGPEPSYKWSYKPYKWPYKWVTGVITLLIRVITPLKTSRGPTLLEANGFHKSFFQAGYFWGGTLGGMDDQS